MPTNKECARRKNEANRQINLMADKLTRKAQGKEPRKAQTYKQFEQQVKHIEDRCITNLESLAATAIEKINK